MKIRNGFVSNSSSSSFILFIPKTDYTCNSASEFCDLLKEEFNYDNEEVKDGLLEYIELLQKQFELGMGCIIESVENGAEDDIERIVNALGGTVKWIE